MRRVCASGSCKHFSVPQPIAQKAARVLMERTRRMRTSVMNLACLVVVLVVAVASAYDAWPTTETHPYSFRVGQVILILIATAVLAANAAVYWQFYRRPHVAKFYGQFVSECGASTTDYYTIGPDNELIEHTWEYMVRRQAGMIGLSLDHLLRTYAPMLLHLLMPYLALFALRHDHHVFLDLVYLRPRNRSLYLTIADKTKQQYFLEEKSRQQNIKSVMFVRRITPSSRDESMVFVKPRFAAFGEDCCVMTSNSASNLPPARAQHMVFEEVLKNHPIVENVVGERAPLCTLRVWTGRWISNRPTTHAAFLVARSGSISNCKGNECWPVNLENHTATISGSGTKLVLPQVAEAIFTANWVHDQFPLVPFLGTDIGLTPDGAVLLETNLLCSYSIYSKQVGLAYDIDDVDSFLARSTEEKSANL